MKVYFLENDLFPATHNFKDEADGTTDDDIVFVDAVTGTGAEIIASLGDHKKVLRLTHANAVRITHNMTTNDAFDVEFYTRHTEAGDNQSIIFRDGATECLILYVCRWDGKFNYKNNAAADIDVVASDNDVYYHHRVTLFADNTFDWYINGTQEINGVAITNNMDDGIDNVQIYNGTADTLYIAAYGEAFDPNYETGDNTTVDWHANYNKEEITEIITYPTISPRLDAYWMGGITIRDFEGALYEDWNGRDFNKILIEDNSSNVLFRGFLIGKTFKKDRLELRFAGIGVLLDWKPFGSEGYVNYILAEGLIKAPISSDSILQLKDADGNDFTWAVDWWITDDKDVGILIVDKTDVNTRTWDSSAISQVGGTEIAGDNASTTTFTDGDYYNVKESTITPANPITIITPVIDGVAVNDTDYLKSITIEYNFRMSITAGILAYNWGRVYLEILKDTTWETIATVYVESYAGTSTSKWIMGVPIDVDGGNGNEFVIEDTDAELQKYFDKTGATYSSLKGMRLRTTGDLKTDGYFYIHFDFINVVVGYMSDDISPVMKTITESGASTATCTDVSAWDETGVVENDGFKIGQNTKTVVEDIASQSGLNIEFINTTTAETTVILNPNGCSLYQWAPLLSTDWNKVDEYPDINGDGNYISASSVYDGAIEIWNFETIFDAEVVTGIEVHVYVLRHNIGDVDLTFDVNLGGWQGTKTCKMTNDAYGWETLTWSSLTGSQADLNGLQVKVIAPGTIDVGEYVRIETVYVKVTYTHIWNKYMAREFRGAYCMEPLKAVCKLEGTHWYEDYINDKIVVIKVDDFVDSEVDLTEADYDHDWEYEDECNQVKSFLVFGKSEDEIFAKAVDEAVSGYISKQLIDESITNVADAQSIADNELALLKTKRPSLKLRLKVDNVALQLGYSVHVTLARPTIAQVLYPIRMLERSKSGIVIKTVIYCGLGESPIEERIAKHIRENAFRSHKSLTDRLISP